MDKANNICTHCGDSFTPVVHHQRQCSLACAIVSGISRQEFDALLAAKQKGNAPPPQLLHTPGIPQPDGPHIPVSSPKPLSVDEQRAKHAKDERQRRAAIKRTKEWQANHPEAVYSHSLRRNYDMSVGEYLEMYKRQRGLCRICKTEIQLYFQPDDTKAQAFVDHDHKTGKVRGLLCRRCNYGIGYYEDWYQPNMRAVQKYLVYHRSYAWSKGEPPANQVERTRNKFGQYEPM
jgi:hypothetical protein